jgi:hypothetical protein
MYAYILFFENHTSLREMFFKKNNGTRLIRRRQTLWRDRGRKAQGKNHHRKL